MISGKYLAAAAGLALLGLSTSASAELSAGAKAPEFATEGALAGKEFSFDLDKALTKGPVVLYFFPKAFTEGCTQEAHAFAEAMDQFKAEGASVIGLSADSIPTLKKFSTLECRDKFPVGMASPKVIKEYDVAFVMNGKDLGLANRTSYVIGQDRTIKLVHSDLDWRDHVKLTLAKVKELHAKS